MKKSAFWLVVVVIGTLILVSCDDKENVKSMVEKVWTFSQSHPDGFTVDVRTMTTPTKGIAVSYAATQDSHSHESLTFVVIHALKHDGYVGGWLDSESGMYYFDSIKIFPEDQLEETLEFARENGQIAVYIISTGEEIRVDEIRIAA